MELLPFGQQVKITHKYLEYEKGWITDARPSYYNGHGWQYLVRTDKRLRSGYFLYGGVWFDEMYLQTIMSNEPVPKYLNIATPTVWPPEAVPSGPPQPEPEPQPQPDLCDFSAAVGKLDEAIVGLGEVVEGLRL